MITTRQSWTHRGRYFGQVDLLQRPNGSQGLEQWGQSPRLRCMTC